MQYDKLTFGARFLTIAPALYCVTQRVRDDYSVVDELHP